MSEPKRYYVTTPIYYVNDAPHIGHAYTTLACDVLARFKRLEGFTVKFLTGTDEHGQKVEKSATAAGMDAQAFTDKMSMNFRQLADFMDFSHDDFIRTTEERHLRASLALWQRLEEAGQIYLGTYAGWYAIRDEAFYGESELVTGADGTRMAPSGAEVEWVEEPSYFFRLSDWQETLLQFYAANPEFVLPRTRRNEVIRFVEGGLVDLSVSRTSFRWGIRVPGDDAHIMYVWLDALTNYITAVGFPETDAAEFALFWPADLHMVGKDILRFHAVYWPAFLMAAGVEPPKRVFAHGWWTNEGKKISKSLGNIIDPFELVRRYGLDPVRYFLLREVPFGNDGDFSHRAIVSRMNGDLANDYGNLAQRVLTMIRRNCGGRVPASGAFDAADRALLGKSDAVPDAVRKALDVQAFHRALDAIWSVVRAANAYMDHQAPWALARTDPARMRTVLYVEAETLRRLAVLTQPFMPDASGRLLDQLAVPTHRRTIADLGQGGRLTEGVELPPPEAIFPRYVDD